MKIYWQPFDWLAEYLIDCFWKNRQRIKERVGKYIRCRRVKRV